MRLWRWWRTHVSPVLHDASFEIFFALLCLLSAPTILGQPETYAPMAIGAVMPVPLIVAWGISLLVSGVFIHVGLFFKEYRIEQAGLALLAAAALMFGMSILGFAEWEARRLFSLLTYAAVTMTCVYRYRYLTRLHRALRLARDLAHEQDARDDDLRDEDGP